MFLFQGLFTCGFGDCVLFGIQLIIFLIFRAALSHAVQIAVQIKRFVTRHLNKANAHVGAMVGNALEVGKQIREDKAKLDAALTLAESDGMMKL